MDTYIPCKDNHRWGGQLPFPEWSHLEGVPCDCTKFLFHAEMCGCAQPKLEIKLRDNPNYQIQN